MGERRRPCRDMRWGIINPWGDVWTLETFDSEAQAKDHLAAFWRGNKNAPDLRTYKVEMVRVTVSRKRPSQQDPS